MVLPFALAMCVVAVQVKVLHVALVLQQVALSFALHAVPAQYRVA
jgi:hypothetical protein